MRRESYSRRRVRPIVNNDIFDIEFAMKIDVLALNGAFDTGLAAVLDAFAMANELALAQGLASAVFDVSVVGVRRQIRTAQGPHDSGLAVAGPQAAGLGGCPCDRGKGARAFGRRARRA